LAWELIDRFVLKQPKLLSSKSFKQFRYANLPFFYRRWVFVVVSRALFSLRLNNAIFGSTTDIPYSGGGFGLSAVVQPNYPALRQDRLLPRLRSLSAKLL